MNEISTLKSCKTVYKYIEFSKHCLVYPFPSTSVFASNCLCLSRYLKNSPMLLFIKALPVSFLWISSPPLLIILTRDHFLLPAFTTESMPSHEPLLRARDIMRHKFSQLDACSWDSEQEVSEIRNQRILRVRILTVAATEVMTAVAAVATHRPGYAYTSMLQCFLLPDFLLSFLVSWCFRYLLPVPIDSVSWFLFNSM